MMSLTKMFLPLHHKKSRKHNIWWYKYDVYFYWGESTNPNWKEKTQNTEPEKMEPPRQKSTVNDDDGALDVYCMECENPSIANDSKNYIPLDEESNGNSEP